MIRVWVGLIVLLAGLGLAALHFQAPREPAAIEQIMLAQQNASPSGTPTRAAAGSQRQMPEATRRRAVASDERHSIVVSSVHVPDAGGRTVIGPEAPSEPLKGPELARALQKELRRVGCYYGEIDGDWGPMSKRAMSSFIGLANATLPVESPDHILLSLVQTYDGQSCGSCRPGESRNQAGTCVPAAVLAYQEKRRGNDSSDPRIKSAWAGEEAERRTVDPLPGRMSIGAPVEAARAEASLTEGEGEGEAHAAAAETRRGRRLTRRARVAERSPTPSYYREPQRRQRSWAQTIFDEISRR